MQNFTQEDLKNIVALINAAPIKGIESVTVASILQKLNASITSIETKEPEPKE